MSLTHHHVCSEILYIVDPSSYLKNLYDDYMEWRIVENPELGTRIGRHERDDRITEFTEEAFIRQRVSLHYEAKMKERLLQYGVYCTCIHMLIIITECRRAVPTKGKRGGTRRFK